MIRGLLPALAAAFIGGAVMAEGARTTLLDWDELPGWEEDDHAAARAVFLETCAIPADPDWRAVCALARSDVSPRAFFERAFRPVLIEDGADPLITGYYEPELTGSPVQTPRFAFPLYAMPPEVKPGTPWLTRSEIETTGALDGRGLELVWLADPVDRFFLQIQGSGRVALPDGTHLRVGFAGKNGHPYRSVGQELARLGHLGEHKLSAQRIRAWVRQNPALGQKMLWHNPSYVFFRLVNDVSPELGPLGAMNRSITAGRSIAVDPAFIPLGAPVWLDKGGRDPLRRLMIAQDTGSAIKGAQRADIFYGTGAEAGRTAGRIRDRGRLVALLPIDRALALAGQ